MARTRSEEIIRAEAEAGTAEGLPGGSSTFGQHLASLSPEERADFNRRAESSRRATAGRGDAVLAVAYLSRLDYVPNAGAVRRAVDRTQTHVAAAMGTDQSSYSKWERKPAATVKQLRDFARAVGGDLVVMVQFPDRAPIRIDTGIDPWPDPTDEWADSLMPPVERDDKPAADVPDAGDVVPTPMGRAGRAVELQ